MKYLLIDYFENAYFTLKSNKGRTFLSMLGIAIGIASVTCILAISDGIEYMIKNQVNNFSGRLVVIRPGTGSNDINQIFSPVPQQYFQTSSLTLEDTNTVSELNSISRVAPVMSYQAKVYADSKSQVNTTILATNPNFKDISNLTMVSGDFLEDETDNNTAVIGIGLADLLFGTDKSIGEMFSLYGQKFTVTGVVKQNSNPINFNNIDLTNSVILNVNDIAELNKNNLQIQQIDILLNKNANVSQSVIDINKIILKNHNNENDFTVITGNDIAKSANQTFSALTSVMTAVATISIIVGGIGIMNIMLVGVTERTREIGIRKAVGATKGALISQFLIESLMISLTGGLIGYLLGYIGAFVVSVFLYFTPAFSWATVLIAIIMSISTGIIFGTYPALKASRRDTIESLRQYY